MLERRRQVRAAAVDRRGKHGRREVDSPARERQRLRAAAAEPSARLYAGDRHAAREQPADDRDRLRAKALAANLGDGRDLRSFLYSTATRPNDVWPPDRATSGPPSGGRCAGTGRLPAGFRRTTNVLFLTKAGGCVEGTTTCTCRASAVRSVWRDTAPLPRTSRRAPGWAVLRGNDVHRRPVRATAVFRGRGLRGYPRRGTWRCVGPRQDLVRE